jgi:hypothetical protein
MNTEIIKQFDNIIDKHLSAFGKYALHQSSIEYFLETGKASGSFRSALHEMMREASKIEPIGKTEQFERSVGNPDEPLAVSGGLLCPPNCTKE